MAYADTQRLTPDDICFNEDGTCYIYKSRQKTGVKYTAVVFPEGVEVLKKYDNRLPSISNQKGNAYLKEIQTICGLTKTLHFHLFRKTYATRLLNRGVRLEVVSKCLGHSSTQITQSTYGQLLKKTIIEEVSKVF
jgi:integrase